MAFARQGHGDKAFAILRLMNPIEHARTPEDVRRYKVEPYVAAADIYALKDHVGRGGWTWYTGSAGWMYRAWLEEVFGFRLRRDMLRIDPVMPSAWDRVTLRYGYRGARYEIVIENPSHVCRGVMGVELDGNAVPAKAIRLDDDGALHTVRILLGPQPTELE
jgi:cellobiose phosphorylase